MVTEQTGKTGFLPEIRINVEVDSRKEAHQEILSGAPVPVFWKTFCACPWRDKGSYVDCLFLEGACGS